MSYETWCKHSTQLLAEADEYNEWQDRARLRLLTDIAPRIGKLSTQMYMGCGFHYAMEQELGNLIRNLALPVQFCANWCAKIPEKQLHMMWNKISMEQLIQSVVKAEKSAKERV